MGVSEIYWGRIREVLSQKAQGIQIIQI
jgi:hypothetical protein